MLFKQILLLAAVTLIPALELRASIPYGIIIENANWGIVPGLMPWPTVALVCIFVNILLGFAVFYVLSPIFNRLERFALFRRFVTPVLMRAQIRLKPYVDRYGEIGVAIFIGIPLPGSGVYTGAVGAFLLGLDRRKFAVANVLGVLIAGTVVTTVSLLIKAGLGASWLDWIIKH